MEDFVTTYTSLTYTPPGGKCQPLPTPARFHLDTEMEEMCYLADINATRILAALPAENPSNPSSNRWHTYNVPGFGDSQNPVTMDDLYWEAVNRYGWTPAMLGECGTLNLDAKPDHPD